MDDLRPHQVGLIEQKLALDAQIDLLQGFVLSLDFQQLPGDERHWMRMQLNTMHLLATILDTRIDAFPIIRNPHDRAA